MPIHAPTPTLMELVDSLELYADAILCGAVAGTVLGFLGIYVVLRRMVFVPLAITHASALGVALAFYVQTHMGDPVWANPLLAAFVFALGTTALLTSKPLHGRLTAQSMVGLLYIASAAAALLLTAHIAQESHEIGAILFGIAVVVRPADLAATVTIGAAVLGVHLWLHRGLLYASFDPEGARVQGLPVQQLDLLLLTTIALMVSVATRALGAIPVFALTVLPAMAALSVARRMPTALAIAAVLGGMSAVVGYIVSFFLQLPVGATQAVVAALVTALAMLAGRLR